MTTILYNCKRCRIGKRIEFPLTEKLHRGYWRYDYRHYREADALTNQGFGHMGHSKQYPEDFATCPQCDKRMTYHRIDGYHNAAVPCDARCTGARGHSCECSCGGKHHGEQWS